MSKLQVLDYSGLQELAKNIPILTAGDNIKLTPDATKSNKITVSLDGINIVTNSEIDGIFS